MRFAIRFDSWYGLMSTVLGLPPSGAYVQTDGDAIDVRMGWAFRARFPRAAIASAEATAIRPMSRGVHGFAGRWLVNGSSAGILCVRLRPTQKATLMGVRVSLDELLVSVDDPAAVAAAITPHRR